MYNDDWDSLPPANAGGDWEKPTPFDDTSLPEFPVETLPEVLREYCGAVVETCQVPGDMAAVSALGTLAVALQGKFKIMAYADWIEPLNLYLMFIANPSDMKSPTLTKFTNAIISFEVDYNKKNAIKIKDSRNERERLEKRLTTAKSRKDSTKELVQEAQRELDTHEDFPPLQLLADDITVEALAKIMQENKGRMSIISSEAGLFSSLKGRYTEGIHIDILLKSFNGLTDTLRINRVTREPIYIENPCLTILLAAQPLILHELMGESAFRGRGFHARFLYSYPVSKVGSRKVNGVKPIPEHLKAKYNTFINGLISIDNEKSVTITLSNEASNLMTQFREWIEPQLIDELEPICDWAGKLHGHILRIAGLLHIAENGIYTTPFADNPTVSAETMTNAIDIGKYFLEHALHCFSAMGANENVNNARYILKRLEKRGTADEIEISKRDLARLCKRLEKSELEEAVQSLEENGYIRIINGVANTGGRPQGDKYILNPLHFLNHKIG